MSWYNGLGECRTRTARHEAGHAVTAYVLGRSFRYVTLRPRIAETAGHVMLRCSHPGDWLTEGAICAAGILAEERALVERHGWFYGTTPTDLAPLHRQLTQDNGRGDMKDVRDTARLAWFGARAWPDRLTEPIDLTWTVEEIATICWRYAAVTLTARWETVTAVTEALLGSSRALTYRQVADIADAITPDPDATNRLLVKHTYPWFLDYSRLHWTPRQAWLTELEDAA